MGRRMAIEVIDDKYAEVLRHVPGPERVRQLDDLYLFARQMTKARIQERHPDWPDELVEREVSRAIADAPD
ncbi:MAG TPA: hypothetical protein VG797_11055 [Phycisphaerales bacterium]|nr:hypothetical protein [Phycisphaerales bacterium]